MAQSFNIHDAKTQFSKLVAAVEAGERVTICRNGRPVMECVPIAQKPNPFPFGLIASNTQGLDRLDAPTDNETLDEMGL